MKFLALIEDLLAYLPRTALLVLAVFVMRNPFAEGSLHRFGWYVRLPLEFVLLLLLALALAAASRLIRDHSVHNKGAKPLA